MVFLRTVSLVSNLGWWRALRAGDGGTSLEVRPARRAELNAAVRLILADASGHADDSAVKDFLQLADDQSSEGGRAWIAGRGGRMLSAGLPVVSPGRTMLLFLPSHFPAAESAEATRLLVNAVCEQHASLGIQLAQSLLEPSDVAMTSLLEQCGFKRLSELLYMQGVAPRNARETPLPAGWRWIAYSDQTHDLFARTIMETYQQSLDCPGLNGIRGVDDILAGHRATGQFNPQWWSVLWDGAGASGMGAVGALLLNFVPRAGATELVYLGLRAQLRGRGLGDVLMRRAMAIANSAKGGRLSLAVDAENLPALKLYWRHGMQAVGRKMAMLRTLSTAPQLRSGPQSA